MSNDYFNHTSPLARHTLGRAQAVNTIFDAIATGFDKLHDPDDIARGRTTFAVDTGVADALVVAMPKTMTAYENGATIWVEVAATNTGACTINVDGLGARAIKLPTGGNPAAGDLTAGDIVGLVYDQSNTQFLVTTPYRSLLATVVLDTVVNSGAAAGDIATLVDDGSGGLTPQFLPPVLSPAIVVPVNVTPASGATAIGSGTVLTGTAYESLYGKTMTASQWQVSTASDFSSTIIDTGDVAGTDITYTVPMSSFEVSTTYYWRCRYKDSAGVYSDWSDATSFTTDNFFPTTAEVAKIVASDAAAQDFFGTSAAISGGYVIVGAPEEDTGGSNAGAAYIFERDGAGSWSQVQKIQSSDIQSGDEFGTAVAIDGDYAVIGAPEEDTGGSGAGAVYVFQRNGAGTWVQVQKLQSSDIAAGDKIGSAVAIDGDKLVFGTIIDGSGAGAAYVFSVSGGVWSQDAKLTASDAAASDAFGTSVAISGNYIVVGAPEEDTGGSNAGSAYFFELSGTWSQVAKVQASDVAAGFKFGSAVAIDGNYAVIGSAGFGTPATSGKAYVFERDGTWAQSQAFIASDPASTAEFGGAVSIDHPLIVVGAVRAEEGGTDTGAAYLFRDDGAGSWSQIGRFIGSDTPSATLFGNSVSLSGSYMISGAPNVTVGGNNAGAAYIFE